MIIHAPNIHNGGGLVLLKLLLGDAHKLKVLIVDRRFDTQSLDSLNSSVQVIRVKPTIFARLGAEYTLFKLASAESKILCFGNLPPLFPIKGFVNLFFQNTLLLKRHRQFANSFNHRFKLCIERWWLYLGLRHVHRVIVQSNTVKKMFQNEHPNKRVEAWPFYSILKESPQMKNTNLTEHDFIYVASAASHKNHSTLFAAWDLLLAENITPSLLVTLGKQDLAHLSKVAALVQRGAQVRNSLISSHSEVLKLYSVSRALIYPSLTESFGLPLLEAKEAGLPIVAAELDYVREYVDPQETFDPHSALSIARAVKRFLKIKADEQAVKLLAPRDFLKKLD